MCVLQTTGFYRGFSAITSSFQDAESESDTMKIDGSCHCGELKYRAEVDPAHAMVCHCTDCQVLSGTAFRSLVLSLPDAFEMTAGTPKIYQKIAASGNAREQAFCGTCGSPLYSVAAGVEPKVYAVRLGTVTQRDQLEPNRAIWCQSAQSWIGRLAALPQSAEQ